MNNFAWDLMIFELNRNRLNDYGAMAVTEKNLADNGITVNERKQYNLLTERLYEPTAGERFDSI